MRRFKGLPFICQGFVRFTLIQIQSQDVTIIIHILHVRCFNLVKTLLKSLHNLIIGAACFPLYASRIRIVARIFSSSKTNGTEPDREKEPNTSSV